MRIYRFLRFILKFGSESGFIDFQDAWQTVRRLPKYRVLALIPAPDHHVFFTRAGIISPVKLIQLSGHAEEKSLAIQCDLAQADVEEEQQKAMRVFPVRGTPLLFSIAASLASPPIIAPCRTQK